MSKLLIDDNPLMVLPTLACAIGLTPAIVLQQIHFLCSQPRSGKMLDGHKWIWNTYEEWKADHFPFWSVRTVRNAVEILKTAGLLITCKPNAKFNDHTLFYRVDVAAVERLIIRNCPDVADSATSQNEDEDVAEVATPDVAEVATSGDKAEVATSLIRDSETSAETSIAAVAANTPFRNQNPMTNTTPIPQTDRTNTGDALQNIFDRALQAKANPALVTIRKWNLPPQFEGICEDYVDIAKGTIVKASDKGLFVAGATTIHELFKAASKTYSRAWMVKAIETANWTHAHPRALDKAFRELFKLNWKPAGTPDDDGFTHAGFRHNTDGSVTQLVKAVKHA